MTERQIEDMCRRRYQNFEAVILPWSKDGQGPDGAVSCTDNGILGLEWKNRDGSGTYQSRYIIDLEKGNIIITGDCGNAIACFSNQLKVEQLSGLVSNIGYFAEKIRCGEGMFTYEPEDIEADLQFAEECWRKKHHENWSDTITDSVKRLRIWFSENEVAGTDYPKEICDILEEMEPNWRHAVYLRFGKRLSARVYMWQIGLQMALEQISLKAFDGISKNTAELEQISLKAFDGISKNTADHLAAFCMAALNPMRWNGKGNNLSFDQTRWMHRLGNDHILLVRLGQNINQDWYFRVALLRDEELVKEQFCWTVASVEELSETIANVMQAAMENAAQ